MILNQATPTSPIRQVTLRTIGGKPLETPAYHVKGLLPKSGVALLAGQYAAGKTFVALDLMLCTALGERFLDRRTRPGGGLWIAAEGTGEIDLRVAAARAGKFQDGIPGELPFFVAEPPAGTKPTELLIWLKCAIEEAAQRCVQSFGTELRLVVIDTLAAAFVLEDENGNAEAAQIMRLLADLGNRHGVLIIPVAHMGKNIDSGVRGASAYAAGADAILSVLADVEPSTGKVKKRSLALQKSRRGTTGPIGGFNLVVRDMGMDEDDDPFSSCFVEYHANDNVATQKFPQSKVAREFGDALDEILLSHGKDFSIPDGPVVKAVSIVDVRGDFHKRYTTGNPGNTSSAKDKAWQRSFRAAKEERMIGTVTIRSDLELMWRIR